MVKRCLVALAILGLASLASSATTYTGIGTNTVCPGKLAAPCVSLHHLVSLRVLAFLGSRRPHLLRM
jgi:hypothetical protein